MEILEEISKKLGMDKVPKLVVIDGKKCAARGKTIFIGKDIINGDKDLLEFMLAHEASHVKNNHSNKKLSLEVLCILIAVVSLFASFYYFIFLFPVILFIRKVIIQFWEIQASVEGSKVIGIKKAIKGMDHLTKEYKKIDHIFDPIRELIVRVALHFYILFYPKNKITALKLFLEGII